MAREADSEGSSSGRPALAGASVLLALALLLPLWSTRMEAPQYKDEEVLKVDVFAGRVAGDIHEIDLLNQYVGVHLPLDTPELKASPWILGGLLALSLLVLLLPVAKRRRAALVLCLLMAAVLLGGGALLQYRLYQMGHDRSPTIMAGVPDFTPPILGTKKIANFWAHMSLGPGGWAYLGAILLTAWSVRQARIRTASGLDSSAVESRPDPDVPNEIVQSQARSYS